MNSAAQAEERALGSQRRRERIKARREARRRGTAVESSGDDEGDDGDDDEEEEAIAITRAPVEFVEGGLSVMRDEERLKIWCSAENVGKGEGTIPRYAIRG